MPDVFISYSQKDRDRVQPIAEALETHGFEVFWDVRTEVGDHYRTVINDALQKAKCVIVVWSSHSVASDWVIDEAEEGKRRGILIPVLLDRVEPPHGFRQIQMLDLRRVSFDIRPEVLAALINAVERLVEGGRNGGEVSAKAPSDMATESTFPERVSVRSNQMRRRLWLDSIRVSVLFLILLMPFIIILSDLTQFVPFFIVWLFFGMLSFIFRYTVFIFENRLLKRKYYLYSWSFVVIFLVGLVISEMTGHGLEILKIYVVFPKSCNIQSVCSAALEISTLLYFGVMYSALISVTLLLLVIVVIGIFRPALRFLLPNLFKHK